MIYQRINILHVKSFKNAGLEAPKSRSGRPESSPGGGLAASWAAPGSKTPSEGILGGSWAVLGASWWRRWLQQGAQIQ